MGKFKLPRGEIAPDHWSIKKAALPPTVSHIAVRLIDGSNLLACDHWNGTSDPICFVLLKNKHDKYSEADIHKTAINYKDNIDAEFRENPLNTTQDQQQLQEHQPASAPSSPGKVIGEDAFNDKNDEAIATANDANKKAVEAKKKEEEKDPHEGGLVIEDMPIAISKVCYKTTNPVWNDELFFPLHIVDLSSLLDLEVMVLVKDQDDVDNKPFEYIYDDLGYVKINIRDVIKDGRAINNSIIELGKKHTLLKTEGMHRVDGSIKLSVTVTFCNDSKPLWSEISSEIDTGSKFAEVFHKVQKAGGLTRLSPKELDKIIRKDNALLHPAAGSPLSTSSRISLNRSILSTSSKYASTFPTKKKRQAKDNGGFNHFVPIEEEDDGNILLPIDGNEHDSYPWENDGISGYNKDVNLIDDTQEHPVGEYEFELPDAGDCSIPVSQSENNPENAPENDTSTAVKHVAGTASVAAKSLRSGNGSIQADMINSNLRELIQVTKDSFESMTLRFNKIESLVVESSKDDSNSNSNSASQAQSVASSKGKSRVKKELKPRVNVRELKLLHAKQKKRDLADRGVLDDAVLPSDPDVELIIKSPSGSIITNKVLPSVFDSIDYSNAPSSSHSNSHSHSSKSAKYHHSSNNHNISSGSSNHHHTDNYSNYGGRKDFDLNTNIPPPNTHSGSPVRMYKGTDWGLVDSLMGRGDKVSAFCEVLDRGNLDDLAKILEMAGPIPAQLSVSVRNHTYDGIATLLCQSNATSQCKERCLIWILELVRGKEKLSNTVVGHTRRDLVDALERVSEEQSKIGMLATLLHGQLKRGTV